MLFPFNHGRYSIQLDSIRQEQGDRGLLLNGENPLRVTKVICRRSLLSHTKSNITWFSQQFQLYNKNFQNFGTIWLADTGYLWFNYLPCFFFFCHSDLSIQHMINLSTVALFVLGESFNCSNSHCIIIRLCNKAPQIKIFTK